MFFWRALNYLNLCGEEKTKKKVKTKFAKKKGKVVSNLFALPPPEGGAKTRPLAPENSSSQTLVSPFWPVENLAAALLVDFAIARLWKRNYNA